MEEIDQKLMYRVANKNAKYLDYLEKMELEDTYANIKGMNVLINNLSNIYKLVLIVKFGKILSKHLIKLPFTQCNQITDICFGLILHVQKKYLTY